MSIDSVVTLVATLRRERLLDADQLEELTPEILEAYDDPRALAKALIQLGWLTVYQVNLLFDGRGRELVIGPYRTLDRLGEGGVSQVFKAWDTRFERTVAVKVLRQDLTSEDDAVRQFQRELQAVTRLNHPNIIKTYDACSVGELHYFSMEFVEGIDLGKVVQLSGPLPVADACEYIRQVCAGLQHAHQTGLVHRDIKPANLFLIQPPGSEAPRPGVTWKRPADPQLKIIDWGLARVHTESGAAGEDPGGLGNEAGMLIGTADYIAPEQARDPRLVDIRADIYSLGCTFYYLLTGQPPFPGTSLMQKLLQHQQADPPAIQALRPDVTDELAGVIQKMLVKCPEGRYQIPLAIQVALRKFCQGSGEAASPPVLAPRPNAGGNSSSMRPNPGGGSSSLRPVPGSSSGVRPVSSGLFRRPQI